MKKMFTLSFDDGTVQDRRFVKLIDSYGLKCTFNLNSGLFGQRHNIEHFGIDVCHDEIEESEVKTLYQNHEVAAHTRTHPDLVKCSTAEIIDEVLNDCKKLSELTGKPVTGMAYPFGTYQSDILIDTIVKNTPVRYARTVESTNGFNLPEDFMKWHPTCHMESPNILELAQRFIDAPLNEDMLFYVWGHSFELDKEDTWPAFEALCKMIGGHEDICYRTNGEVYAYSKSLETR